MLLLFYFFYFIKMEYKITNVCIFMKRNVIKSFADLPIIFRTDAKLNMVYLLMVYAILS